MRFLPPPLCMAGPMSTRFYVDSPITGPTASLAGAEAHHLLHVMRAEVGDRVVLFDGSGLEYQARVAAIARSTVELAVHSSETIDRELARRVTLGVALPKGDRRRWLVEKLVELGVARLVPLETARSVAQPSTAALARLHRTVVEASKQCGRNRLMEINEPRTWADYVSDAPELNEERDGRRLMAHPGATPAGELDLQGEKSVRLAVGPEGGFDEEEISVATAAGWEQLDLGPRILRVETAAVTLAALMAMH